MRILILFLSAVFLAGCGLPVNLRGGGGHEGPQWPKELSSRVDEGQEEESGKIRSPKQSSGKKTKRRVERRTIHDIVTPKPIVPEAVEEKPEWVEDLEEQVTVNKIGKQKRPPEQIGTDLVAEEGQAVEEPEEPEEEQMEEPEESEEEQAEEE